MNRKKCPTGYKPVIRGSMEICIKKTQPKKSHRYVCRSSYNNQPFFGYVDQDVNNNKCVFADSSTKQIVPRSSTDFLYLHNHPLYRWTTEMPVEAQRVRNTNGSFLCRVRDEKTKQYYPGYTYANNTSCNIVNRLGEAKNIFPDTRDTPEHTVEYMRNSNVLFDDIWRYPKRNEKVPENTPCKYKNMLGIVSDNSECMIHDGTSFVSKPIDTTDKNNNYEYLYSTDSKVLPYLLSKGLPDENARIRTRKEKKAKILCSVHDGPMLGEYDEATKTCKGVHFTGSKNNWAGYEIGDGTKCGPNNGNKACPNGQCCSKNGTCGAPDASGAGPFCEKCRQNGVFDTNQPSYFADNSCPGIKNPLYNWAGFPYTTEGGRCGPNFGNKACPKGQCCTQWGACAPFNASTNGATDNWCTTCREYGLYDDTRPAYYDNLSICPNLAQPVPTTQQQGQPPITPSQTQSAAVKNWSGYEYSQNGRCGPIYGNKACPKGQCCTQWGVCASFQANGEFDDVWCTRCRENGLYDDKKPSYFDSIHTCPNFAQDPQQTTFLPPSLQKNWDGHSYSSDGKCGPENGNKACTDGKCCTDAGVCANILNSDGSTNPQCGSCRPNGRFDDVRPTYYTVDGLKNCPNLTS